MRVTGNGKGYRCKGDDDYCYKNTHEMCEDYAKIALLMFCQFHKLEDIHLDVSYWKLFHRELKFFKNHEDTTSRQRVLKSYKQLSIIMPCNMINPNDQTLLL